MRNEFIGIYEQSEQWWIGSCPEVPGANGQGSTLAECRINLAEAIALMLEHAREDCPGEISPSAIVETVVVENSLSAEQALRCTNALYVTG